jgi:hypothetical protein
LPASTSTPPQGRDPSADQDGNVLRAIRELIEAATVVVGADRCDDTTAPLDRKRRPISR